MRKGEVRRRIQAAACPTDLAEKGEDLLLHMKRGKKFVPLLVDNLRRKKKGGGKCSIRKTGNRA